MKTTVVPAQITTVEDRIAGNFTFPQIVLLIIPLLTSTAIYAIVPIQMHMNTFKVVLVAWQFIFFGLLALRFRGKIIADWLVIYLRFKLRPRFYIFTKNDTTARDIAIIPTEESIEIEIVSQEEKATHTHFPMSDKVKVDRLLENPALSVSFKFAKKGGLDVSLKTTKV